MAILEDQGSADATTSVEVAEKPLLYDGQWLDQPTFHELYLRMPENFRAELIDGVVYVMSSPVSAKHGRPDANLILFINYYSAETPGTLVQSNTTAKLGQRSEVQPDSVLLIEPEFGGRTTIDDNSYTLECPELVIEIASSTLTKDMVAKKKLYEEIGALEYIVYDETRRVLYWFALTEGHFEPLEIDADGIFRSRAFPGLWLDRDAFLRHDRKGMLQTLRQGLESPEHAAFVERLRENRAKRP